MTDNRKKGRAGSVLRTIILVIALGVFCFSAYKLITIYLDYKQGSDEYTALEKYADLQNQVEPEIPEDEEEPELSDEEIGDGLLLDSGETAESREEAESGENASREGESDAEEGETQNYTYETEVDKETGKVTKKKIYYMTSPVDFDSLKEINEDIIGWLKVGALDLSYPITQAEDNDYYLHRTFERVDNFAGCIFMDYQNHLNFLDDNTMIYGHNMKDGSMFGTLRKFLEEGVYDSDPYFWIYTPKRIYKYHIFNCTTVGTVSTTYTLNFGTRQAFQDYLDVAVEQAEVETDEMTLDSGDKIATLSTCTGDTSTRFVVQGKLERIYAVYETD
ncbi:MAG: class B sortase [Candidatus Limivivens sp.]|nr:class B sortase [Candidatus Limivivens sp.]